MEDLREKQITLQDYLRILYRGRWIIVISFFTVLGFVIYYTYTATPIYTATAKVMFRENKAAEQTLFNITRFGEKETMINNQVQILTSRTLAEKVIHQLEQSEYADKLVILGNRLDEEHRKNGFVFKIKNKIAGIWGSSDKKDEHDKQGNVKRFDASVSTLLSSISINPVRNTDIVEISVNAPTAFEAAYVTNTLSKVYQQQNQLENQAEVRKVKDFLAEQLDVIQNQLKESEVALKEYKEREKVVALPAETEELVKKITEFETLYRGALLELESTQKRLNYVNDQLDKNKQNFNTEAVLANPFIEEIKKQMADLESEKARYIANLINRNLYTEEDPTLRAYEEKIKLLSEKFKARIAKLAASEIGIDPITFSETLLERKVELEATVQSLLPKVDELKKIVNEYNRNLESVPSKSLRLARLERSAKLDEKLTLMMKEKYEESRITEVGQLGNVRIIDPAKSPVNPVKPKKKMNIMLGVIFGLGLGMGITFLIEHFDNSVRYVEDIQKLQIPVLGSIPVIKIEETVGKYSRKYKPDEASLKNNRNGTAFKSRLITHFAPKSPISEAYRSLRTSIQFSKVQSEKPIKTFLVTSSGPQEGKSTTVANLAITMAQMGSKVLLADTDLRRPILHSVFAMNRDKGISNYLIGKIPLDEAIFETSIDNLYLMPSGTLPPNPSELLGSKVMNQCIKTLEENFDIILFDSPPVIAVTDAVVLGAKVDGVILVVKSGYTDKFAVERSYNILQNVCKEKILGALLNVVNIEGTYGSYYYYYYHYYYGSKNESKRKKHHISA